MSAEFTYEGCKPLGRGEAIDGAMYTFKAVDAPKYLKDVPFNVNANDYEEAVSKLQKFVKDSVVVDRDA